MSMYKGLTNIWYTAGGPKECCYYGTLIVKISSWDDMDLTHILLFLKNNVQVFSRYLSADLYLYYFQVTVA